MLNRDNFEADPDEPLRGEAIERIGVDGEPNGLWSKVKFVTSSDPDLGKYEVVDNDNRQLIVCWESDHWLECTSDG